MIIPLRELIERLRDEADSNDTQPSESLWIKFGQGETKDAISYRTTDENTILQIYLDNRGVLVGIEIFP